MKKCALIVRGKVAGHLRGMSIEEFFRKADRGRKMTTGGKRQTARLKGGRR